MRLIPSLPAVRVFEAAARHENFTRAAAELGMTQAAVSYQIRLLEERLGVGLFRREKKKVMLTDAGRRASGDVSRAFDVLDAAFSALRSEEHTSELQSLMRISYAVFCLKKKRNHNHKIS